MISLPACLFGFLLAISWPEAPCCSGSKETILASLKISDDEVEPAPRKGERVSVFSLWLCFLILCKSKFHDQRAFCSVSLPVRVMLGVACHLKFLH